MSIEITYVFINTRLCKNSSTFSRLFPFYIMGKLLRINYNRNYSFTLTFFIWWWHHHRWGLLRLRRWLLRLRWWWLRLRRWRFRLRRQWWRGFEAGCLDKTSVSYRFFKVFIFFFINFEKYFNLLDSRNKKIYWCFNSNNYVVS